MLTRISICIITLCMGAFLTEAWALTTITISNPDGTSKICTQSGSGPTTTIMCY